MLNNQLICRYFCLCFCVAIWVAISTLATADDGTGERTAKVFVFQETSTLYGKAKNGDWKAFYGRRDVALFNVYREKSTYRLKGCLYAEQREPLTASPKWIAAENIVSLSYEYKLTEGDTLHSNAPDGTVSLVLTMPLIGIQWFYLPQYDLAKRDLFVSQGIVEILSCRALSPQCTGLWAYRTTEVADGLVRVTGPLRIRSDDHTLEIIGKMEKTVQLDPLKFVKMSGGGMVVIEQPETWSSHLPVSKKELSKSFGVLSKIIGHYHYLMIPLDSKDAKTISIPERLRDEFAKLK